MCRFSFLFKFRGVVIEGHTFHASLVTILLRNYIVTGFILYHR